MTVNGHSEVAIFFKHFMTTTIARLQDTSFDETNEMSLHQLDFVCYMDVVT